MSPLYVSQVRPGPELTYCMAYHLRFSVTPCPAASPVLHLQQNGIGFLHFSMEEAVVRVPIAHNKPNKKRRRNKKGSNNKGTSPPLNISFSDGIPSFDTDLFPLLLASASRDGSNPAAQPLLRRLLRRIRRWLLRSSQPVPPSLLSLLPLLLSSRYINDYA